MLFANDIILVDETREEQQAMLEGWRQVLESRGFKLRQSKADYMKCNFSTYVITRNTIKLETKEIASTGRFTLSLCFREVETSNNM